MGYKIMSSLYNCDNAGLSAGSNLVEVASAKTLRVVQGRNKVHYDTIAVDKRQ